MLTMLEMSGATMRGGTLDDFPAGGFSFHYTTYLNRGAELTGNANSRVCTLSFWLRYGNWGTVERIAEFPGSWSPVFIDSDDTVRFAANNPAGDIAPINMRTSALPRDGLFHHIVFAWDMNAGAYVAMLDGVDVTTHVTAPVVTDIGWTGRGGYIVGRRYDTDTEYLLGALAEYYFNPKEFFDVRIPANLARLRNAAGRPVPLGPDGSWVTGKPPIVYFRRDPGAPASDFRMNRGTGGNTSGGYWAIAGNEYMDPIPPSSFWTQVYGTSIYDTNAGWAGYTLRYRINTPSIKRVPPGQTQVRVTVAGDPNSAGPFDWDKLYIGHQVGSPAWRAGDLTQLFFNGSPSGSVGGSSGSVLGFLTSDPANWKYDGTSPVLLTVHSTTSGAGGMGVNNNVQNYYKSGDEAGVLNPSGYSASSANYAIFFAGIEMM